MSSAIVTNGTKLQVGDGGATPGTASATMTGGNTGGGTIGSVVVGAGAKLGHYAVEIVTAVAGAGTFKVTDPDGIIAGIGQVGTEYDVAGLTFTWADGAPDMAEGDSADINVTDLGGETFSDLAEVVDIDQPSAESAEVEVTHLGSAAKEFKAGLRDFGTAVMTLNLLSGNSGHEQLEDDAATGTIRTYRILYPDAVNGVSFRAFVKGFKRSKIGTDQALRAEVTFRATGAVTRL